MYFVSGLMSWQLSIFLCSCLILGYSICCWIMDIKQFLEIFSNIQKMKYRKIIRNPDILWCSTIHHPLWAMKILHSNENICDMDAFFVCICHLVIHLYAGWLLASVGLKLVNVWQRMNVKPVHQLNEVYLNNMCEFFFLMWNSVFVDFSGIRDIQHWCAR